MSITRVDFPTQTKRGQWFDIRGYGAVCDGATDDTAAVLAAHAAAVAAGGGIVFFPAGTTRCNGQLLIPNDIATYGATQPIQKTVTWMGVGAWFSGWGGEATPQGGTILDLRYGGSTGKIDTRGYGALAMEGITFADYSTGNTTPFIFTTNTTILLRRCGFYGSGATPATSTTQDAIVLGGTTLTRDNTATAPFGGYGSVIDACYFSRIRRAVYGRVYANALQIVNNTIWAGGGGDAAIFFEGQTAAPNVPCDGGYIAGNLIEMVHYQYGIKLDHASHFCIVGNNLYDHGVGTLGYYHLSANAIYNTIIDGTWTASGPPIVTDLNTLNNFITADTNETCKLTTLRVATAVRGILPHVISDAQTTLLATAGQVVQSWTNTNATNNNWVTVEVIGSKGGIAAAWGFQVVDQTNEYAELAIGLRGGSGFREIMRVKADGGIKFGFLKSSDPGAGSKEIWYDGTDSNRVKYTP